ncbi:MAG: hypothetical protein ACI915_003034 [Gammaproteobacteria bacterium]|jgi:hypothetical protein
MAVGFMKKNEPSFIVATQVLGARGEELRRREFYPGQSPWPRKRDFVGSI